MPHELMNLMNTVGPNIPKRKYMGLPKSGKKYQNNRTSTKIHRPIPNTKGYQNLANPNQNMDLRTKEQHSPPKYTNSIKIWNLT